MTLTLYTESFFNSAHFIENHPGKCATLHGHSWKICLWIRGEQQYLDNNGILWDFGNIKKITEELDHKNLNTVLKFNPTAENITLYIYKKLKAQYPHLLFKVRIYESSLAKQAFCETGDFEHV